MSVEANFVWSSEEGQTQTFVESKEFPLLCSVPCFLAHFLLPLSAFTNFYLEEEFLKTRAKKAR